MIPKKIKHDNLSIFKLINVNNDQYTNKINEYFEQKKVFFYIALSFMVPIVIVMSGFLVKQFHTPWWSYFIYMLCLSPISFFILSQPIYFALTKELIEDEDTTCLEVDSHLSELASQEFFTKDARARRFLNQEFKIVALTHVTEHDLNLIENNKNLTSVNFKIISIDEPKEEREMTAFYQSRTLSPIILAKITLFNKQTKQFSSEFIVPLEFTRVRGLVSEQLTYLEKDDYIINPMLYIDYDHFNEIYIPDRTFFLKMHQIKNK